MKRQRCQGGAPSLCSSCSPTSVVHSHFLSTSVCQRDDHAVCPFLLPVWMGDAASHFLLLPLSLLLPPITHTQTAAASALPTTHHTSFLLPPLPPTFFFLQPQSFSLAHVYAQKDAALLHFNAHSNGT